MSKKAAYLISQVTCAHIELIAMISTNMQQTFLGNNIIHDEADFMSLIDKYHISKEEAMALLGTLDS